MWKLLAALVMVAVPALAAAAPPSPSFVVVSTDTVVHECSGAGGEHYVLELEDGRTVHAGGHAVRLGLLPRLGAPGRRWFVAEVVMVPRTDEDRDGNPDSSRAGWCLDRLPRFDGEAVRLVAARDRADARALQARLGRQGLARQQVELAAGGTDVAVVRVTGAQERGGDRAYALEVVDGRAPAELVVPAAKTAELAPWTGDLLVVTLARGAITRALLARDRADASRWAASVAADGWPPAWISPGWGSALATARWAAFGRVVKSRRRGCGLELAVTTHGGTALVLEPMRVAAPAGAKRGDRVSAVLAPLGGRDRCGRAARVERAYVTPGETSATWMIAGSKAPAAAIVE